MKKTRIWLAAAAAVLMLCACGEDLGSPVIAEDDPTPAPTQQINQPVNTAPESIPPSIITEDDSQPPHSGMVRSRLTNEWVDANVADTRPIAVMIPNESAAIPHYSLSEASVIYEANVEGRMSRMMAIYEGWQNLSKIGNIRSLRTYYAYWAFEWDAFIVHYGGPYFINDLMAESTTQHIDGNLGSDSIAFYRDSSRAVPHNGYTTGAGLAKVIQQKGYPLSYRGLTDSYHYNFTTKSSPNALTQYGSDAQNATYIDMSGCYPLTRCYFEYNENDGLYYRSQHLSGGTDGPHLDGSNNEQLSFKNIIVQYVKYEDLGDGYLVFQCHDTTRDGWYFTNGKGIHINWEKTSDYGATRYYDDYGNEILMNTGKTMICVVEEGDSFTYR
ncbi:MAG: DUF3048 domain-containing protein [Eubacterium sp.]|nr:DUF3048 domain-containing protein [Eubacterium sp.]MCM1213772.1 DUF3048 domain-containing protein [Lachnospiraceae bacterium]MCM1303350.1 DUF3048 domain-containing protein [Butyrivibrio sp.]MCM1342960.1 DUF3048 domain-containing protein [Muribaculaceae bacterium]MCM1237891.1 DUF3048 domain-containing protein [Lachnospiraceae bacterium]